MLGCFANQFLGRDTQTKGVEMRKLLMLLVAVTSIAAIGAVAQTAQPAAAASKTVKITHTGYSPTSVAINVGDVVVFTNSDTVAHTVVIKPATGIHCTRAFPLVLQPGQSASCTFGSAGSFNFTDPANKGKAFRGTVSVAKAPAVSLAVAPKVLVYGYRAALSGTLANKQAGESLHVLAQPCGQSTATQIATVTTTSGGAYAYVAQPLKNTVYTVKFNSSTSNSVTVKVRPRLRLGKIAPHRYSVRVFAAQSFAGKYASFQRYRLALRRWVTVKRVLLRANSTGVAPTVITSARFRSSIKPRLRVRVVLGQAQVGSCYLAGRSNTIRS
jgi:plastocyanin